jgi:hypothetical protein
VLIFYIILQEKQGAAVLINSDNAVVRKNSDDIGGQPTGDTVRTYEQVALLTPQPALIRTIVLIGPPGVGRNELQRRLLLLNPDRFGTTVPHTSRPMKPGEVDGVDYHFVDRSTMENHIKRVRVRVCARADFGCRVLSSSTASTEATCMAHYCTRSPR